MINFFFLSLKTKNSLIFYNKYMQGLENNLGDNIKISEQISKILIEKGKKQHVK